MRCGDALTVVARRRSIAQKCGRGVRLPDASFGVDPRGIRLDQVQARQATSSVFLRGRVDDAGRMTLSALARDVDLERLPGVPMTGMIGGRVDFAGLVTGSVDSPVISGAVLLAGGRFRDLSFDTARGRITLQTGRLTLEDVAARSGRSRFALAGQIAWGAETRLDLDIQAEHAPAGVLSRWLQAPMSVSGQVDGRIRLYGLADRPSASGRGVLRDAEILGQHIDEASAAFRWDGTRLCNCAKSAICRGLPRTSVSGRMSMQSTGQGGRHSSQPVQSELSTVCMKRCAPTIASTGQAGMHLAQPMQRCSSITATRGGDSTP
jgi:hypothetical protein